MYLASVFVLLTIYWVKAGPSFIKPCSLSDPKIDDCALKNANEAFPIIVKGVKEYKIPVLASLHITEIKIDGQHLQMKFTDISSNLLAEATITRINIDDEAKTWSVTFEADILKIFSNYNIKGRILVFAISGEGPANVNYTKPAYTHTITYKDVEKHGEKYLELVTSKGKFVFERTYYKFDNLFNGNKRLGDEMNAFLNENWESLENEWHPVVVKTIREIVDNVIKNIFAKVPRSEIFLP